MASNEKKIGAKEKKDVKSAALVEDNPGILSSHPPIIITDGSAAIEYTEGNYQQVTGKNVHVAIEKLHLVDIVSDREHTVGKGDKTCHTLVDGEQCEIEIACEGGGGFNNFIIRGNFASSPPPELEFDRGEYKMDTAVFPPRNKDAQRFGSKGRRIRKLQIFKVVDGKRVEPAVHDCPLVAVAGNGWTFHDDHA